MKKSHAIALVLMMGASTLFFAQDAPPPKGPGPGGPEGHQGPGPGPGGNPEKMAQELNLSADQKAKWEAVHDQFKHQSDSLRKAFHEVQKSFNESRHKLDEAKRAQIKNILTPEQYTKFLEMKEEHGQRPPRRGPGGPPPVPGQEPNQGPEQGPPPAK